MCADNKLLGNFELTGIPPAPRGVPQIEVSFDIDANGIVHVNAKDLGTGREQSIQITASSGLSDDEIDQMVKDAEAHADEDKKKQQLIEARNQADTLVYTSEKSLRDLGDKVDPAVKADIEGKIEEVKKALEADDPDQIKAKSDELAQASHKLAEQLYAQQNAENANPGAQAGAAGPEAGPSAKDDDDVVDADYTEVK
jgi:molecular chaperone DnaK